MKNKPLIYHLIASVLYVWCIKDIVYTIMAQETDVQYVALLVRVIINMEKSIGIFSISFARR